MADRSPDRLRSVLKLAKRDEESAQQGAASAARRSGAAGQEVEESNRRVQELDHDGAIESNDFKGRRQRAALRADQALLADENLREMLEAEIAARDQLRGAVRRRRSLEKLEGRRLAVQAGLAAHAAQRSLDELATMRGSRNVD